MQLHQSRAVQILPVTFVFLVEAVMVQWYKDSNPAITRIIDIIEMKSLQIQRNLYY